jgi:long-chain acyl-CoA synthetase
VDERDRFLTAIPLFHSFGAMACMLVPALVGACSVHLERFRPEAALAAIGRERITIWPGVPGFFAAILAAVRDAAAFDLSCLRLAVTGGAPMPVEVMRRFESTFGCIVLEGNGPTESGPVSYVNPARGPRKPGSVGLPLPGVEVRVVDEREAPLPPGEVGELCIRGPNVMRGYWNRPEETAAALRGGWLHTGDLGYRDQDGYVFIVDRKTDLILVGGLNVYPREVEEVLTGHPAVAEAAVVGRPDPLHGQRVVACVVLRPGAAATPGALAGWCRERLAAYKCPRRVEILAELPRNPTGKVRKDVLRAEA